MDPQTALANAAEAIKSRSYSLGTAESCTGGGIGALVTSLAGSSEFFIGGIIAYSNRIKHDVLGVPDDLLETCGAVSSECARAMAEGAANLLHADVTVAVTGIAGPGGGSSEKPVGLVYIAARSPPRTIVRKFLFTGNRRDVREATQLSALELICELFEE